MPKVQRYIETPVTMTGDPGIDILASPNIQRKYLGFFSCSGSGIIAGSTRSSFLYTQGIIIAARNPSSQTNTELWYERHGVIVQQGWFGISPAGGGGNQMIVLEMIEDDTAREERDPVLLRRLGVFTNPSRAEILRRQMDTWGWKGKCNGSL